MIWNYLYLGSGLGPGSLLTHDTPNTHVYAPWESTNTHAHDPPTCEHDQNTHMHTSNRHIHKAIGEWMHTNGMDEHSDIVRCGGGTKRRYGRFPIGSKRDILASMSTTGFRRIKKHDNKPATKTTNKWKRVQPRSHHRGIAHQKPKTKETGQKHVKTHETRPKQHGQWTQAVGPLLLVHMFFTSKKSTDEQKERSKIRTARYYIWNAWTTGISGGNKQKKHKTGGNNNATTHIANK